MNKLPIREIVLYKHGVGFFVREGETDSQEISLSFRRDEINDVLKSLTVFDRAGGRITGIYYQTPIDQATRLAESGLNLSEFGGLRDLMRDLRGRGISVTYTEDDKNKTLIGRMVSIESHSKGDEKVVVLSNDGQLRIVLFDDIRSFRITDDHVNQDLAYFLDNSITEENRQSVSVRLTEGNHQLVIYYIAPSPTWRVSYRIVAESDKDAQTGKALLQGWGIFDNRLDEDLENIRLTLIAGQPISFIYDLAESHVPNRPRLKDNSRQPVIPMEFDGSSRDLYEEAGEVAPQALQARRKMDLGAFNRASSVSAYAPAPIGSGSIDVETEAKDMGELFQYLVMTPVSVKRGESALVPIISTSLKYERELLYNRNKNPFNPVVTLRFDNSSGLMLERGPITVVEDSTYKGEAVVPFTKPNNAVYLPFAVELNIKIKPTHSTAYQSAGLKFQNQYLVEQNYLVKTETYLIENLTNKAQTLTLEVPFRREPAVEIFETPPPDSTTLNELRWRMALPQSGITQWEFKTRQMIGNSIEIRKLTYKKLQDYLSQRFLDQATYANLKEILDTVGLIETLKQKQAKAEEERTSLYRQNDEWRRTVEVLKSSTNDDPFRARLLKQLEDSDARTNVLIRDMRAIDAKINACEKRIDQLIEALPSGS